MKQIRMFASQGEADLEPLSNALPVGPGRSPDLLVSLAKEPVPQVKERILERHLVREVLSERLSGDAESTSHLVEVERGHPLLLHDGPRRCQDGINGLLPVANVGISLGGWLALDYATRQPERVHSLVLLCPGGIGRQKVGIALKTIPLRFLGHWGTKKARELVLGPTSSNIPPMAGPLVDFIAFIHEQFRPRLVKLPIMSDAALQRLSMPVLAILGGKDALLDSAETRFRLEHTVPHAKILYYPESGHLLPTQTSKISDFLREAVRQSYR
jgi:pimeloyl-ACP methyl ester carboxylesterase